MANIEKVDVIVEGKGIDETFGKLEKQAAAAAKKLEQLQDAQFRAELAGRSHSEKVELLRGRLGTLDQQTVKYANTLGKLRTEQAAVGREAERMAAQQAAAATKLANEQKRSITSLLAVAGIGFSIYGIKSLVTDVARGTYELGQLGAQAITVRDSFSYMLQSVGMNADVLRRLQTAAGGTINSMKLMELSNMALVGLGPQVGNALASQEARLIEISRAALKANPAIGSVEFAYNSLVLGVKRLEKRLVDNIGLQVKVNDANEKYAASIGKTVDQLSAEDKQMAMLNAILEGGSRLIQQVGGDVNTMNDSFLRATTSAQEFKIALGEALAPSMSAAAEGISSALDNMTAVLSNDDIQKKIQEIKNLQEAQAQLEQQRASGGPVSWWIDFSNALELGKKEIARVKAELASLIGEQNSSEARFAQGGANAVRFGSSLNTASSAANRLRVNLLNLNGVMPVIANSMSRLAGVARAMATDFSGTALLGFTDVMSIKEYSTQTQNLATYEKGLEVAVSMGLMTRQEADYQLRKYTDSMTDHYGELQKVTNQTEKLTDAERELQSAISSAIAPSFSVDELAPGLVGREDAVDEHYRRLAALALRGNKELEMHQGDWIKSFQGLPDKLNENASGAWLIDRGLGKYFDAIPDEIKKKGSEAIKGWASSQDWADTLAEIPPEVRAKGIEAMQAWAKDKVVAYGKGLDNSLVNRERIKALVMEQLQANKMRDELVNEIFNEMGGTVSLKDVQAAAGDVTGTGSAIGQAISTGVKDSIDVEGMLKTTASAINAGAKTYAQQLKTSGGSVGGIILDGITTAVTDGAPDIIKKLAEALSEPVAKIIENNARRSGG